MNWRIRDTGRIRGFYGVQIKSVDGEQKILILKYEHCSVVNEGYDDE